MRIRLAESADAPLLPDIERSAGQAFLTIAELAWVADDDVMAVDRHLELIENGLCWVATGEDGRPIGFLSAEAVGNELHIEELAVRSDRQGQGCGRKLLDAAVAGARARGLSAVTLTTFRSVPWNEPFYSRVGFRPLDSDHIDTRLSDMLYREERTLVGGHRCAMRLALK